MSLKGYHKASLCPPAADDAPAATEWDWGEALIDSDAYMVDKENHTSARCELKTNLGGRKVEMRVTLCLAPPPRVSYFCCHAYCPDGQGEEDTRLFVREPSMSAMEGNLALITLCHGDVHPSPADTNKSYYEYLVYQAASSPAGKPELTRLQQPAPYMLPSKESHCFRTSAIGIVRYRSNISAHAHPHKITPFTPPTPILSPAVAHAHPKSFPFTPPTSILSPSVTSHSHTLPKDDAFDAYRIAALSRDFFPAPGNGPYYLCTYDSKTQAWTRKPGATPQPLPPSDYMCDMVITIGGSSGGIIGWADLWTGMLLSDVLADHTPCSLFRYVSLPEPRQPPNWLPLTIDIASSFRDIVLVKDTGIIRFVDLQVHAEPSPFSETPSGWTVVTWTLEGLHGGLETLGDLHFRLEHELHSRDIDNYDLPKSLFVSDPVLSSHRDGVLYLRTNVSSATNRKSRVIAVDIKEKKLLKVDEFDMRRPNTYSRTTISSYLIPPVSKENMK